MDDIKKLVKDYSNQAAIENIQIVVRDLRASGIRISFEWVKGHASDKWNARADQLASACLLKHLEK